MGPCCLAVVGATGGFRGNVQRRRVLGLARGRAVVMVCEAGRFPLAGQGHGARLHGPGADSRSRGMGDPRVGPFFHRFPCNRPHTWNQPGFHERERQSRCFPYAPTTLSWGVLCLASADGSPFALSIEHGAWRSSTEIPGWGPRRSFAGRSYRPCPESPACGRVSN